MKSKELALKVVQDLKDSPSTFAGIKIEIEKVVKKVLIENAKEIAKLETEDQFYDFISEVLDAVIILPMPYELFDGAIINFIIEKGVDKVLDKWAGKDWFEKAKAFVNSKVK